MEKIKIGNACDILNGFAFKSDQYVDEGIRVIRIANVQKGYIEDNAPAFYPVDTKGIEKYMLDEGDLLMSLTGNVGRVAILEREMLPAALNQRVACLRLKTDKIEKGYLFHILNSDFFEKKCIQASNGVAQKNMSTEWLKEFSIPVYTKEEQKRITIILDKLRNAINIREKELHSLDELIKARFVELFGDPRINPFGYDIKELGKTCKVITGNTPSRKVPEYYGSYLEWIKTDNIVAGLLNPTEATESLSESGAEVGRYVEENAILMACIAGSIASIGKVCVTDRRVAFNQQINAIVPNQYNTLFLYTMLQISKDYLVEDINMALKGILSKSKLEEKIFIVPPLELQNQFADFVKQVDKSKVVVQKALNETQTLFDSQMQEYFG